MAFARAQAASGASFGNSASAGTVAYGSNVTAGNLLLVCVGTWNTPGTQTVTISDTLINSWSQAGSYSNTTTSKGRVSLWYAIANGSGANTVSVLPSSLVFMSIGVMEYSGNASSSVIRASATGASGTGTVCTTNTCTATAGDLVIAVATQETNTINLTMTAPFTRQVNQPNSQSSESVYSADDLSASGSEAAIFTFAGSCTWSNMAASFKPASGASRAIFRPVTLSLGAGGSFFQTMVNG